jgi:hypothetical protein
MLHAISHISRKAAKQIVPKAETRILYQSIYSWCGMMASESLAIKNSFIVRE